MTPIEIKPYKHELVHNVFGCLAAASAVAFLGTLEAGPMLTRAGIALTFFSVAAGLYRVILQPRFDAAEEQVYNLDREMTADFQRRSVEARSDEQRRQLQGLYHQGQSNLYSTLARALEVGKREKAHLWFALIFAGLGAVLQIAGTP